jgi:TatA/E family protein of Tat protein translocase
MFGMGTWELLIIMFIVLLVFGSKKLPELAQGLGKGIREFKKASSEIEEELDLNKPLSTPRPPADASETEDKESKETGENSGDKKA